MPPPTVNRPLVTAVVLSWNGAHLLRPCLDSLRAQTIADGRLTVWVVDNASADESPHLVQRDYPDVRLIRSDRNRGFAGGMNLALRQATTPYVALINNDARLEPDAIERLLAAMNLPGSQRVAAATAKILLAPRFSYLGVAGPAASAAGTPARADAVSRDAVRTADGELVRESQTGELDLLNSTGNVVRVDGYGQDRDWLAVDRGQRASGPVFGLCGATALLRMAAVDEVGPFDEDFFLYYEDTDLSWRFRLAGWEVRYVADAVVRHEHAASSGEGSAVFRFHDDRNRLLTLTKNASLPLMLRAVLRYPLTAASLAVREAPRTAGTRLRARVMASYLRLLPRMLVRRVSIGRRAVVSRREVERMLSPVPTTPVGDYRSPSAG